MTSRFKLPPLSLYIHIPWCVRKCPYCDFNSHQAGQSIPEAAYVNALLADFEQELPRVQGRKLESIFFGGGTPSLFSVQAIDKILSRINALTPFSPTIETTLEANPGTFEQDKFSDFRQAGINRLSIGIQSFNDSHLKTLGRIHSSADAISAINMAIDSGFINFNLDLMHGLPNQSTSEALSDLARAFEFQPTHLSWYQLTIEPNTVFFSHPPRLPKEDTLAEIEDAGKKLLTEQGLHQYEVSAYSKPDKESRHNLNYWQFGDYLGIGAGAHGKITMLDDRQVIRTSKTRLPKSYLDPGKNFLGKKVVIPADQLAGEFFMNALRLNKGFNVELFESRTGLPIKAFQAKVLQAEKQGLLVNGETILPTEKGRLFLNDLVGIFV